MRAAEQLAKRQREYPLGPAGDRVGELFQSLPPLIDPQFEKVRSSPNLVVGEMNFRQPNAKAFHYPDGSHLITIYSGLIDFYTSNCRILAEESTFHSNEGTSEGRTLEDFIVDLAALFRAWTPEGIRENRPDEINLQTMDKSRSVISDRLLAGALRFILCHELGHVVFYDPAKTDEPVAALTKQQEVISDAAGMRTAISCTPNLGDIRMNLAGCVISLRLLAVFQALGHPFTGDHPDPLTRVNNTFAALRPFCKSHAQYWAVSPIAYAFDELLETASQRATGGSEVLPLRPDRSFSRMCSAMEESLKERQPKSIIVPLMAHDFTEATDEEMAEIAMFAAEMFAEDSSARLEGMLWAERGEFFRSIYHQWPARAVAYFDYAFAQRKQAGV